MPRHSKQDISESLARLREWIKPGDTVYTVLDHVSRSGMMRHIRVLVPTTDGSRVDFIHPNYAVGVVLGLSHATRNGHTQDALKVGGAGMDMGFHLVNSLSYRLYPEYTCTGENCPSPEHGNNRRRETCDCGHKSYNHTTTKVEGWHREYGACEVDGCACQSFRKIPNVDHRGAGVIHRDGYALRHKWL